ncbi:isoquinoline 1-oxidoreductase alpha subunit [Povalibacter uvarum]|uniref:Isoquinoline 1-oxidoreductase alpha subunit n=1 Tax=Povalibacter uvarum TaxID=732238 RepID=A0A841HHD5_9GAMM|nr:(2Fe-2S)-binding protein [Povalibacter uvarum]MBB6091495.1 isoquinoline 1-oxidoreductase alpha subunit [Povalibacter uvarum]
MELQLLVNGEQRSVEADADTPLLWVLRESLALTGTKFGCGIAACGACTVHINGTAARSCSIPAAAVQGQAITTIEGLAGGAERHAVQQAWIEHQVPQCGYCQSGMIMAAASLLAKNSNPTDQDIDAEITNLCRCGTYERIRRAIHAAALNISRGDVEATRGEESKEARHG